MKRASKKKRPTKKRSTSLIKKKNVVIRRQPSPPPKPKRKPRPVKKPTQVKRTSTQPKKKADAITTVKPNLWKAFLALFVREMLGPIVILLVLWAFKHYDYYFIIQDIGSALDVQVARQAIDLVIYYAYFIVVAIGLIIMFGHYIPLVQTRFEYDSHELRIGDEIIPYRQILRVNFKNDLFYHKMLDTAGLYLLFTGREYLPYYLEFVDDASHHAQQILNYVERDKRKRYKK